MTPSPAPNRPSSYLLKTGAVLFPVVVVGLWAAYVVPFALSVRREAAHRTAANPYFKPYSNPYPRTQNVFRFGAVFPARTTPKPSRSSFLSLFPIHGAEEFWDDYGESYPTAVIEVPSIRAAGLLHHASARASNGDTFVLGGADSYFTDTEGKDYAVVRLPWPGAPASYQWIDMTFVDNQGNKATWRITEFPRLDHAVSPSDPLHTRATVQGLKASARVWWDEKAAPPISKTAHSSIINASDGSSDDQIQVLPIVAEIKADVPKSAFTRPEQEWRIKFDDIKQEWDVSPTPPGNGGQNTDVERLTQNGGEPSVGGSNYSLNTRAYNIAQAAVAPTPASQRVARIRAHLTKTESLTETLVFRSVPLEPDDKGWRVAPRGAVLTTPSGVRVTLSPPTKSELNKMSNTRLAALDIAVSPENGPLPNSPLQKTVGAKAPIRITCDIPNNRTLSVSHLGNKKGKYTTAWLFFNQPIANPVLPFLTVTVTQEAQTENVPLTFTVPVKHGAPTEKWSN